MTAVKFRRMDWWREVSTATWKCRYCVCVLSTEEFRGRCLVNDEFTKVSWFGTVFRFDYVKGFLILRLEIRESVLQLIMCIIRGSLYTPGVSRGLRGPSTTGVCATSKSHVVWHWMICLNIYCLHRSWYKHLATNAHSVAHSCAILYPYVVDLL